MDNLIYWHKYDKPVPYKNEYTGGIIEGELVGEYRCLNNNVERVWQTGSFNPNVRMAELNLHLLMKDGIRKDFYNFNLNEDYSPVQDWLTENNY